LFNSPATDFGGIITNDEGYINKVYYWQGSDAPCSIAPHPGRIFFDDFTAVLPHGKSMEIRIFMFPAGLQIVVKTRLRLPYVPIVVNHFTGFGKNFSYILGWPEYVLSECGRRVMPGHEDADE
jgi:hypothetical protein